jgi:hypothetical protein
METTTAYLGKLDLMFQDNSVAGIRTCEFETQKNSRTIGHR